MCFLVNISKFLRPPISKNICERLLLNINYWLLIDITICKFTATITPQKGSKCKVFALFIFSIFEIDLYSYRQLCINICIHHRSDQGKCRTRNFFFELLHDALQKKKVHKKGGETFYQLLVTSYFLLVTSYFLLLVTSNQ